MVNCYDVMEATLKKLESQGYDVDPKGKKKLGAICDSIMVMPGFEVETFMVSANKKNNTINFKIGTFFMELEDIRHDLIKILSVSKDFSLYVAGKDTPDAMVVVDIRFPGIWTRREINESAKKKRY